jgi:hypothetical protein
VVFIGLLIVVVILLAISVKVLEGELAVASESAYTQAHGVSRAATVISVTSNGRKSGSENVAVSLADPAGGQQSTTVHVPSTQSFSAGATVQILIDPQDPGYAELPGQRYTTASTAWGTATAFWLVAALLMLLMIPAARSWGRQRRRRASPSAATGTPLPAGMRASAQGIDTSRAHPARTYNYMLGGKNHFAADRETADKVQAWPSVRVGAREQRKFLGRAVGYLASEAGIRHFLDIGTGLPPPTTCTRSRNVLRPPLAWSTSTTTAFKTGLCAHC